MRSARHVSENIDVFGLQPMYRSVSSRAMPAPASSVGRRGRRWAGDGSGRKRTAGWRRLNLRARVWQSIACASDT